MAVNELKVDLKKYRLFFNGQVEAYDSNDTHKLLLQGLAPSQISTSQLTPDIEHFNSLVETPAEMIQLSPLDDEIFKSFTPDAYLIPDEYKNLDLTTYVKSKYEEHLSNSGEQKTENAARRINIELDEIKKRNVELLFKTIIYIVDIFKQQGIIYGIGRGSSCASYILFLIGLNSVDPLKFDISIEEFFH